jgi:hypothetical protein
LPNPAETEPIGPTAAPASDEVFVRAIDLPTPSLRQAKAAVAQQLDILSPLPPAEVAAAVVLVGPTEAGLNRYAVGLAPRRLLAEAPAEGRTVTLIGRLDGEVIAFRFERPRAGPDAGGWIEIATIAGACLAILLAGANLRVDREIDAVQAQVDVADTLVQQRSHEVAQVARVAAAWRAAAATRKAGVIDCALARLAKASGGPVRVAGLALAGGQLTARLADPPADPAALKALGLTPAVQPAVQTGPVTAAAPADAVPAALAQDFQLSAAACR